MSSEVSTSTHLQWNTLVCLCRNARLATVVPRRFAVFVAQRDERGKKVEVKRDEPVANCASFSVVVPATNWKASSPDRESASLQRGLLLGWQTPGLRNPVGEAQNGSGENPANRFVHHYNSGLKTCR